MNKEASNKLLKIIEEPPNNVFFFLVTENLDAVLGTIKSRTQLIRIGKISNEEMGVWLKSAFPGKNDETYINAVKNAEGIPSVAIKALNSELTDSDLTNEFILWARLCYESRKKMPDLINWADDMARNNKEDQKKFLIYGLSFFRSGLINMAGVSDLNHGSAEELDHVSKFSKLLTVENSTRLISEFEDSIDALQRFANAKLLFMNLSIKFGEFINPKNVNL